MIHEVSTKLLSIYFSINFSMFKLGSNFKVIKEKWGQYFANDHFCTPLCSKRNCNIAIKKILEQKFAKSSVLNLVPNA